MHTFDGRPLGNLVSGLTACLALDMCGCGDGNFDSCVDHDVSIEAGVFGIVHGSCEFTDCSPIQNALVTLADVDHEVGRDTTDEAGYFEVSSNPGSYSLCYNGYCATIDIVDIRRFDLETESLGARTWTEIDCK